MARKLAGYEKETIINFNEAEAIAYIFTYNKSWQRHLERELGLAPAMVNGYGGKSYEVDKELIKLPRPRRQLSEKTRVQLARQAENMHQKAIMR